MTDIVHTGIPGWVDNEDQYWPRFFHPFAYFDPRWGSVPEPFANEFAEIALRARTVVTNWDADTLLRAVDFLDWLLVQTPTDRQLDLEPHEIYTMEPPESTVCTFKKHWAHFDVEHWFDVAPGAPAPTWQRLFATLALAMIGDWCFELHHWSDDMSDALRSLRAGQYTTRTMEAVCYAEQFKSATILPAGDTTQQKLAAAGKKGAAAKHAETNAVRRKVTDLYYQHPEYAQLSSGEQAGLEVAKHLSKDDLDTVTIKTIQNWIRLLRARDPGYSTSS